MLLEDGRPIYDLFMKSSSIRKEGMQKVRQQFCSHTMIPAAKVAEWKVTAFCKPGNTGKQQVCSTDQKTREQTGRQRLCSTDQKTRRQTGRLQPCSANQTRRWQAGMQWLFTDQKIRRQTDRLRLCSAHQKVRVQTGRHSCVPQTRREEGRLTGVPTESSSSVCDIHKIHGRTHSGADSNLWPKQWQGQQTSSLQASARKTDIMTDKEPKVK